MRIAAAAMRHTVTKSGAAARPMRMVFDISSDECMVFLVLVFYCQRDANRIIQMSRGVKGGDVYGTYPSLLGAKRRVKFNVAPDYSICGVCSSIGRF
jgi:hypothetical protein